MNKKTKWSLALTALLIGGAVILWYGFKIPGSIHDQDLIEAARSGDYEGAANAISAGGDPRFHQSQSLYHQLFSSEESYESAYTALHYAAESGHTRIVELLLNNGADVNAKNGFGNTPLLLAINHTQKDTVLLLLKRGADVTVRNKNGAGAIAHANKKLASPATLDILAIVRKAGAK